jgi:nicotinamide-nucleotide amidase
MRIHLVNTGAELMLGRVLNTHQQWICRQLADRGYVVTRQVAVDDSGPSIQQAVRESLEAADLILVTGGLGPTSDDRTRDLVAALLGRGLQEDAAVVAHIERFFAARGRPMPASTRVQAQVPEGATVLMNPHGTAPGLVMDGPDGQLLVMLPGPPRELRPMFTDQVLPLVTRRFPGEAAFVCRTLRTIGMGESLVEERIDGPLQPLVAAGLEIGYCARVGEVDVRFAARGPRAHDLVRDAEAIAHERLGGIIYGTEGDSLESSVVRALTARHRTLALAESCTGGFIAHRITNVPGASVVFLAGLVTYSNEAKQQFLGVGAETLAAHGAVSEATVRAMAEGARQKTGAHYAVAVTGIAGPSGGTPEKPVGTVWIGLATPRGTEAVRKVNAYDRETFKQVTAQQALDLIRRAVEAEDGVGVTPGDEPA